MSVTVLEEDIKTYPENLHNEEANYEAVPSELGKLIKEIIAYLEGIEKDNKEIEEYIKKLQKEYDVQQQKNKTEPAKQEEKISSKKPDKESEPSL